MRMRNIAILKKRSDRISIYFFFKLRMLSQCFQFRSKHKQPLFPVIIKWFNPSPVPDENYFIFLFIKQNNGKHSPPLLNAFFSPLPPCMKNDLAIRMGLKMISGSDQFIPDLI